MGAKKTIKLSDGRDVVVDVSTLTQREWRSFFNSNSNPADDDRVLSRLTGLEASELEDMLHDDYRRVMTAVVELASRPLDNPNSQSAST